MLNQDQKKKNIKRACHSAELSLKSCLLILFSQILLLKCALKNFTFVLIIDMFNAPLGKWYSIMKWNRSNSLSIQWSSSCLYRIIINFTFVCNVFKRSLNMSKIIENWKNLFKKIELISTWYIFHTRINFTLLFYSLFHFLYSFRNFIKKY